MRSLWKMSFRLGTLVSLLGAPEMGLAVPLSTNPIIAQTLSPTQQLLQTRSCQGCNLSNQDLRGLDLSGVNLQGANLSNANLTGSNLRQAQLIDVNLYLADLQDSNLSQASLNDVNLQNANLAGATFEQASLNQVSATYANFSRVNFAGASIENSNFSDANLTAASFETASITATRFDHATLGQANLGTAAISEDSFQSASMEGTTLPSDNLTLIGDEKISEEKKISSEIKDEPGNQEQDQNQEPIEPTLAENKRIPSPLQDNLFPQPTAQHLSRGDLVVGFPTNRQFFNSDTQNNDATASNLGVHIDWGVTDTTELGVSFQVVDTGSPERQGPFNVRREDNRDVTIRLKQRVWQNKDENLALSVVPSVAFGDRSYEFSNVGPTQVFSNNDVVPALQIPVTKTLNSDRLNLTLSPTVVFFPEDHALFLRRPPVTNPGDFGTNFGLAGAVSYEVNPRLTLWGDAFFPFTGNNSLNLDTGLPARAIAFNSGLRYLVNPRLGLDLFASNTLGHRTPLGITAERTNVALGLGVSVLPEIFSSNRKYGDSFNRNDDGQDAPLTVDGLGFADGGTVPKNRLALHLQGGQQGILTALRYGALRDFEVFGYLDYVLGRVDESEQGFGLKVRLLDQESNGPVTISAAASVGLTNEVFRNFIDNDPTAFNALGEPKRVPLVFQVDNPEGRRFLVSASLPIHYKFNDQLNAWFTPTLGYAQRLGVELVGFNLGGSFEVVRDFSLVAEVGANFIGRGNSFNNARLVDRVPWTFAARWNPSAIFGRNENALIQPHLELYVTNRTGSSIWNQLRVREGGDPAIGAGVLIPL